MSNAVRYWSRLETPIGLLTLIASPRGLWRICFPHEDRPADLGPWVRATPEVRWIEDPVALREATDQLAAYFQGERFVFDLPLDLAVTPFQRRVLAEVQRVPYGETRSYGEIARRIGRPRACRAVGMANRANPLPIVIPCHRIVGADGSLTGYAAGLDRKAWLLAFEREKRGIWKGASG